MQTVKIYSFNELSDEAKQVAFNNKSFCFKRGVI